MKKLFIAILGVAAFAACSQEMTLETPKGAAIAFDNAFVENAVRANDLTAENIYNFGVYGSVINSQSQEGMIFNNQEVTKSSSSYIYSPEQYWIAGATYDFVALAPRANANWTYAPAVATQAKNGTITFNNEAAGANQDLIFASAHRETAASLTTAPDAVAFTFNHVLSRVKFTFKNGFAEGQNIELKVTNVHITNAHKNGTLAVENGATAATWTPADANLNVDFGDAGTEKLDVNATGTTEHFYLIPAEATYNVTFDVELFQAGVSVDTYNRYANVAVTLEKGKSYDFQATLNQDNTSDEGELYPIEFTVADVEDWVETTVEAEATTVATADELVAAVAAGGDVRLTADITLTASELNVAADKEVNVELNGKTLTVNSLDPIKNKGKMTISNGKVEAAYGENTRRCIYNCGEMVIDGVEFVQTYDKKGAAINNEGKLTINNATVNAVYYSVWCSGADSKTVINGGTFTTTNNVELRDTWAYAVLAQNGAKLTVNGGAFTGNHGVIAAYGANSLVTVNGGAFNCTATYTGNSDWVFYTEDATIRYDESECTITSANPSGNFHSSQVGTNIIAF